MLKSQGFLLITKSITPILVLLNKVLILFFAQDKISFLMFVFLEI